MRLARPGQALAAGVVAAVLLVAGCGSSAEPPDGSAAGNGEGFAPARMPPEPGLQKYYSQQLYWRGCGDGFQCAELTVPLDYNRPRGRTLSLDVVRLPADDPQRRVGSLVVNPGGPGVSGVAYARSARKVVSQRVRARFDIVGFDPRGVGESAPVHCLTDSQLDRYFALDASPDDPGELRTLVEASRRFARNCQRRSGELLPHVGTANAARDMDVLRAALGEPGLTYLGFSYGTHLGAYYAQLFPDRVRALVLDGAINPALSGAQLNIAQAKGFAQALRSFAADCVQRSNCPLGGGRSVDAALARLDRLLASIDRSPLPTSMGAERELTQALAATGVAAALYNGSYWPMLRQALRQAINGNGTKLMQLANALMGRQPDGTYTNQTAANMAINCLDRPMSHDLDAYKRTVARADRAAPRFGEFIAWGALPCAFWPARDETRPHPLHAVGAAPILVVGTTRDPATPYAWAKALAGQLRSGVLLTRKGDGHTAYRKGSACIDRAVDRYLITRDPPRNGKVCS